MTINHWISMDFTVFPDFFRHQNTKTMPLFAACFSSCSLHWSCGEWWSMNFDQGLPIAMFGYRRVATKINQLSKALCNPWEIKPGMQDIAGHSTTCTGDGAISIYRICSYRERECTIAMIDYPVPVMGIGSQQICRTWWFTVFLGCHRWSSTP